VVSSGVLPDLEIPKITVADGHRMIFPLTKNSHSIEEIKAKASLAPVGRQVVDTSSRLSHQLLFPDDIRVDGDQSAFQNLLSCIQSELGIAPSRAIQVPFVRRGCFFCKHRDHERFVNQVGTMVLQFPSIYEGGELSVWAPDALKKSEPIATGVLQSSTERISYTSFYTDCFHEVKKITGSAAALSQANNTGDRMVAPAAGTAHAHLSSAREREAKLSLMSIGTREPSLFSGSFLTATK
jgi:hypothetical protein